jgi:hypothetical protein
LNNPIIFAFSVVLVEEHIANNNMTFNVEPTSIFMIQLGFYSCKAHLATCVVIEMLVKEKGSNVSEEGESERELMDLMLLLIYKDSTKFGFFCKF